MQRTRDAGRGKCQQPFPPDPRTGLCVVVPASLESLQDVFLSETGCSNVVFRIHITYAPRVDQSGKAYIVPDGSGVVWESVGNSSYWFNGPEALPQKVDP